MLLCALFASICAPNSNEFTHLILEKTGRTAKVLFALARGAWILKSDYISACIDAGRFLPESEFMISDLSNARRERERLALSPLAQSASGARRASSLSGGSENSPLASSHGGLLTLQNDRYRRLYLHGEFVMDTDVLRELIAACGGIIVSAFAQCSICISSVPLQSGKTKSASSVAGGGGSAPVVTPEVRPIYRPCRSRHRCLHLQMSESC